jgi:hypothetical protein
MSTSISSLPISNLCVVKIPDNGTFSVVPLKTPACDQVICGFFLLYQLADDLFNSISLY